jgi:hypothetical protein
MAPVAAACPEKPAQKPFFFKKFIGKVNLWRRPMSKESHPLGAFRCLVNTRGCLGSWRQNTG